MFAFLWRPLFVFCWLFFGLISMTHTLHNEAFAKEKVLLDTDMVDAFDDGITMLMLAASPKIDLVGVTTVTGNSWAEEGTAYSIYQLDIAGKKSIPVAMGAQFPLRSQRHANIALERKLFGIGRDIWMGSFGIPQPASWQEFYTKHYGTKPAFDPITQHAVDFIIDTVRKNPNEITIAAIGPCTNLAMAITKAPDIVPLIKRVIYMGGSFFQGGNVTPAAEFNWWFDPEAARIAVRAPFKEQIVVGLDVAEDIEFKKEHYERYLKTLNNNALGKLLQKSQVAKIFAHEPDAIHYVWDVIVSAILIDPSLITKEVTQYIDINDQFGLSYGQSLAFPLHGPAGAQKARIILDIDEERFWNMLNEADYWKDIRK